MDPITIGLSLASKYVPDIIKYFTNSDTAGDVATKVIDLAKTVTGTSDGDAAVAALAQNPAAALQFKLAVLASQTELEKAHLADAQAEQHEQQETIRGGDQAVDEYVRRTRPSMARQSWYATGAYLIGMELLHAFGYAKEGAVVEIAMLLVAPAGAYMGFRTWDKRNEALASLTGGKKP